MHYNWIFDLPAIQISESDLEKFLTQKRTELEIFLSYYFKKEGAIAENVKLKSGIEFVSDTSGSLVLEFDLVHFNACLAIYEKAKEEMIVKFEINGIHQKLNLTCPSWPSREMDEI